MFDLGWSELLVIGIVALIVVGPKDLPMMFRKLGEFTGRARAMAREFSSAMDKAADETGVKDIQRDLRAMSNPRKTGLDAIKKATGGLDGWEDDLPSDTPPNKPATTPPVSPPSSATEKAVDKTASRTVTEPAGPAATDDKPA